MEKFNFITKIIIKLDINPNIVTLTGAIGTIIGGVLLILDLRVASILFIAIFSIFCLLSVFRLFFHSSST